jgi:hypothetical protein
VPCLRRAVGTYLPICPAVAPFFSVLRIAANDAQVFSTKTRAPYAPCSMRPMRRMQGMRHAQAAQLALCCQPIERSID